MNWGGKKIHCVGIKGTGISGLALLLKSKGAIISGSDTAEEFPSEVLLKKHGIEIKDFAEENIAKDLDLVIYSGAWKDNIEMEYVRKFGITELSYGEALGEYAKDKKAIVVTGTHGKTTTTALLGQIFETAGLDPDVLVGDIVRAWGSSIRAGSGDFLIVEGDEYQEKFKFFKPVGILIPSLDYDHPDYFKDAEAYKQSFVDWIIQNPDAVVVTNTDVSNPCLTPEKVDEKILSRANFIMPGENYKKNALLAIRLSRFFKISEDKIINGINNFKGVGRRLDLYSPEGSDFVIMYDYAHHPVEIKSTLSALKEKYQGYNIVAIFQPHTYSRTKTFLDDFAQAFSDAHEVYFQDIYGSAREKQKDVKIEDLIELTKKYHNNVRHFREFRIENYKPKILFVFMGAGDIWQTAKKLSQMLFKNQAGLN